MPPHALVGRWRRCDTVAGGLLGLMALATVLDRLLHEGEEERAGVEYRAAVLGVILHADIPRMSAELYRLDEPRVRVLPLHRSYQLLRKPRDTGC